MDRLSSSTPHSRMVPVSPESPTCGLLLCQWISPAGFPWQVVVARTWWEGFRGAPPAPRVAMVLVPLCHPRVDLDAINAAFNAWRDGPKVSGASVADSMDEAWKDAPVWASPDGSGATMKMEALWDATPGREASSTCIVPGPTLSMLWRDAPWSMMLDESVAAAAARRLGLPPYAAVSDIMVAAIQASTLKVRKRSWPPRSLPPLQSFTHHPLPSDLAYSDLLRRYPGSGGLILAFLNGSPDDLTDRASREAIPKLRSERFRSLREARVVPALIPLLNEELPFVTSCRGDGSDAMLLMWTQFMVARWLWLLSGGVTERFRFWRHPKPSQARRTDLEVVGWREFVTGAHSAGTTLLAEPERPPVEGVEHAFVLIPAP